ncbi:hypothetical protein [Levilactobacillus suantsaii]|uniref:Uncharacterized protein n=1 Tax=Levilactobacillus suantsaii TaxID=2292255 RepID=A0A4Q0VHP3_9LACO|nr:hypothetical protein [Levilactobacillus suantsaii]QMU08292.1 hypothetical protein H3M12_01020 [Levilactobacillus suantsaii]RXI78768.1 hypothetical protein DXH47_05900 [Levilactobacillus suantsaii]
MKKSVTVAVIVTSLLTGTLWNDSNAINLLPTTTAQAATIRYHGHKYHSKYSIRQMRKKYHLKYKQRKLRISKKETDHIVWNQFFGIQKNPTIRREIKMPMFKKLHGTYAAFLSEYVEAAFNSKIAFVNLKTGKLVMSHSGWN